MMVDPDNGMMRHPQAGFSMIEVLIAVLILAVGLLGLGSLQIAGVQNNHSAYQRSQATLLSAEITDAMRANRWGAINGRYNGVYEDVPDPGTTIAESDVSTWMSNMRASLPGSEATINVSDTGEVEVRIRWLDERSEETEEAQEREFEFRTEI